jgi:HK97 family phage major capsid protein
MLESVKIQRRQSEIRQALSALVGKSDLDTNETRSMDDMSKEYEANEARYRAALIAESEERRAAGAELETRADKQFADLVGRFEMRQVALHLDEGRALTGETGEVVAELRNAGGYRGVPIPLEALEIRNTVSTGTPDPMTTRPIIQRLFPNSVAARMGGQMIQVGSGSTQWPVTTSSVTARWADGEGANVPGPTAYTTVDKAMSPDNTLGIHMRISRKALQQSGASLEAAIRSDMNSTIAAELDKAIFLGTGADGQPLGVIAGVATYGIASTAIAAAADWAMFRAEMVEFLKANAANGGGDVRLMIRPEVWDALDDALITGTAVSEWDRLTRQIPAGNIVVTSNALAAPAGDPAATSALMTTSAGGISPFFVGLWGAVDLVRDPYSDSQSGGLRLTALTTADVTVARGVQSRVLTGIQ